MTLIVAVTSPESIWLLADRRLTKGAKAAKDDARKVMILETTDAVAILGYVGVGATALGTEPVDWMSNVLRGRNLPLEQSLGVLADAAKRELPRHMLQLSGAALHTIVATALMGDEPRLYTIDLVFTEDRMAQGFRYTRHILQNPPRIARTPPMAYGGSGGIHLAKNRHLLRNLRRLVAASNRNRVTPWVVADELARVNYLVSESEPTVGDRSIVVWRNRTNGVHRGGGGLQYYTKLSRDRNSPVLPMIGRGFDLQALFEITSRHFNPAMTALLAGQQQAFAEVDKDKVNADLATIPEYPDEKLR